MSELICLMLIVTMLFQNNPILKHFLVKSLYIEASSKLNGTTQITHSTSENHVTNDVSNAPKIKKDSETPINFTQIPVGLDPQDLAINSNKSRIYVLSVDEVSVIDGKTDRVVHTIPIDCYFACSHIAVNEINDNVYVTSNNTIQVIDEEYNLRKINFPKMDPQSDIAVNTNSNTVYVTNGKSNTVSVIDGKTDRVVHTIPVGQFPTGLAIDSKRNIIYVANSDSNTISIINGTDNSILATTKVTDDPFQYTKDYNSSRIYVTNSEADRISVIDGKTNNIVTTIIAGNFSSGGDRPGIAVNSNTNTVFMTNPQSGTISIVNGTSNMLLGSIQVGRFPVAIAINPENSKIYVANSQSDTVSVIVIKTTEASTIFANIDHLNRLGLEFPGIKVGDDPNAVAVNQFTDYVYVTNGKSNTVSVIDGKTDKVVHTIPVGQFPSGIVVNSDNNTVYVTNGKSNTVSMIDGKTDRVVHYSFQ